MQNISAFGLSIQIFASTTYPNGITVREFGDDADPLDIPDLTIGDSGMGTNGDMVVWSRPEGIEIGISVIPGSADDINLSQIHEANRVAKGKVSARDTIQSVINYPSGGVGRMINGIMITGQVLPAVASSGRLKTRTYKFRFETVSKSGFVGS
jgi:hypothetical protein